MAKRLEVTLKDADYREIQRIAQLRHVSLAAWVREALETALGGEPTRSMSKKREGLRLATQHEYPTGDVDQVLADIKQATRAAVNAHEI